VRWRCDETPAERPGPRRVARSPRGRRDGGRHRQVNDPTARTPARKPSAICGGRLVKHYRNPGEAIGDLNRMAVRRWFEAHLCGTQRECAEALGLSIMAVGRHVKAIRAEWREEEA
jgi:hypothetical protein